MTGRSLDKVSKAILQIKAASTKGKLSAMQLDVTDEKSIDQAVAYVEKEFGLLDVLINNAAIGNGDPHIKTRFQACMETNVTGPAMVAAAFRPLLFKSQKPYSIYVSSGVGSLSRSSEPYPNQKPPNPDAYHASKAALNMIAVSRMG